MTKTKLTKNIICLVNNNFVENDTWATLTYSKEEEPTNEEQAKNNVINFIRGLEQRGESVKSELKYVLVTHFNKTSEKTKTYHHVITSFPDKEVLESLWRSGRSLTRRLMPDEYGLEGIVRYIVGEESELVESSLITNISEQ